MSKDAAAVVETVSEVVKESLSAAIEEFAREQRAAALEEYAEEHDCLENDDVKLELRQERAATEEAIKLPWTLLEAMGVDRRECEQVFDELHPLDVLRQIRLMPRFRAFIRTEAARIGLEDALAISLEERSIPPLIDFAAKARKRREAVQSDFIAAAERALPQIVVSAPLPVFEQAFDGFDEPPPIPDEPAIQFTDEQERALVDIEKWYRESDEPFFALIGPAGSGKTTITREAIRRLGRSATLTAMTGKAALRLSQCAGEGATTLHKALYYPPKPGETVSFTRLREAPGPLVLVDEASMMTPAVFDHLHEWTWQGTKILLVGDAFQLPPVVTGDELKKHGEDYSVFSVVQGAHLETVMRAAGGVLRAATKVRETGEICRESDDGYEYLVSGQALEDAVEMWLAERDGHMLITWKNSVRMRANRLIRQKLGRSGRLPDVGEPVLIRKNGQGLLNGEIIEAGEFSKGPVLDSLQTLWMTTNYGAKVLVSIAGSKDGEEMDGGQPWVQDWRKYHAALTREALPDPLPISWGYTLTAHAAQGSEERRVTVFLEKDDVRNKFFRKPTTLPDGRKVSQAARWVYTATTRSKSRTTMIVGK